jgi:cytidylate kinase
MIKNADMRIWLYAPKAARAVRVARRDSMSVEEAERHIEDRDESNRLRYLDIYKIDIYDHSGFDLIINSEKFAPSQSAAIIAEAALQKATSQGRLQESASVQKKPAAKTPAKRSGAKKGGNKKVSKKRK